ncbi:hypothetical protein UFOVP1298_5 [uncultured Caudovirales phage]|uniref:Uncharacterized protein n=1 Tax=uncultured Caudovirales phage TaxID=2100421 RepID=A0A6J5RLW5_9CAUD|nr:hypothetical protein UFOVP1298_5 [uncultured Caudovirales phage]
MQNVSVSRTININLTAQQWQLYTATQDCEEVAEKLNRLVAVAINMSPTRGIAAREVGRVLSAYANYGASDSEPIHVATMLLDEAFPEPRLAIFND